MDDGQCVLITVSGADTQGESVSLSTRGRLHEMEEGWMLRYEETSPNDMEVIDTLVLCQEERVTVTRAGTLLSTLVFDEHETFVGEYRTPVGSFQLRVLASEVSIQRRGLMGHIKLVYSVSLGTPHSALEDSAMRYLDIRFSPCRN